MKIVNFQWFSVAKDGRNDTSDTTQFVGFVARIYMGFNITQEFAALMAMKGTTVCAHLYAYAHKALQSMRISMHNLGGLYSKMADQQRYDDYNRS
jgi:hypothetical protein